MKFLSDSSGIQTHNQLVCKRTLTYWLSACLRNNWLWVRMPLLSLNLGFNVVTSFSYRSNTFISNTRLKLVKNQANAKQNPEVELLLFKNYSRSWSTLSFKNNSKFSKNKQRNKCICIHEIIQLMIYINQHLRNIWISLFHEAIKS